MAYIPKIDHIDYLELVFEAAHPNASSITP